MIRADMIPDEVVEAAARTLWPYAHMGWNSPRPKKGQLLRQEIARANARAALRAGIAVWREARRVNSYFTHDTDHYEPAIILPLPQENTNDQA